MLLFPHTGRKFMDRTKDEVTLQGFGEFGWGEGVQGCVHWMKSLFNTPVLLLRGL